MLQLLQGIHGSLEQLYPAEFKEYRRRWLALPEDERSGRCLDFTDWRVLVLELAEQVQVAEMLGEPLGRRAKGIRRILLADDSGGEV